LKDRIEKNNSGTYDYGDRAVNSQSVPGECAPPLLLSRHKRIRAYRLSQRNGFLRQKRKTAGANIP
jgi:hypothetical protein